MFAGQPERRIPSHEAVRGLLKDALRGRASPVLVGSMEPGFAIPAASLWTGMRTWVRWLRESGLSAGDRVVVSLPRSPGHAMAVAGCWWEGLTACVVPAGMDAALLLDRFDARVVLTLEAGARGPGLTACSTHGGAPGELATPRLGGAASIGDAVVFGDGGRPGERLTFEEIGEAFEGPSVTGSEDDAIESLSGWSGCTGLIDELWSGLARGRSVVVREPIDLRDRAGDRSERGSVDGQDPRGGAPAGVGAAYLTAIVDGLASEAPMHA